MRRTGYCYIENVVGICSVKMSSPYGDFHEEPSSADRGGIYSPAGALLRSGRVRRAQHVGEQVTVQPEWRIDSHLSLTANYTHFLAGRFLRETGPGKDIDYAAARLQYRF